MAYLFSGYLITGSLLVEDIYRWNYIDGYELSSMKIQALDGSWNHSPSFKIIPDSDNNYVIKIIPQPSPTLYVLDPQISVQARLNILIPYNIPLKTV